jgi:hypothetical protein
MLLKIVNGDGELSKCPNNYKNDEYVIVGILFGVRFKLGVGFL